MSIQHVEVTLTEHSCLLKSVVKINFNYPHTTRAAGGRRRKRRGGRNEQFCINHMTDTFLLKYTTIYTMQ